jgi:hypothetical protein
MASPFDINASLSSSASSGVQGGDSKIGDFNFKSSKPLVPDWAWLVILGIAALVVWKKFKL